MCAQGTQTATPVFDTEVSPSSGRLATILNSHEPFQIIVADEDASSGLSIALRIAHDLDVYHKLDCSILRMSETRSRHATGSFKRGNVIIAGLTHEQHVHYWLGLDNGPISVQDDALLVNGRMVAGKSLGTQKSCCVCNLVGLR